MVKTKFRAPPVPSVSSNVARPPDDDEASNEPLFRKRALEAASNQWAGTIILAAKVPMRVAGSVALILLLGIGALLVFGEYTRKVSVMGQMVPSAGSIKVIAHQFGLVKIRHAMDGARSNWENRCSS